MKIEKIRVYQADLPVNEGSYNFADGKAVSVFDSTVVEIITDSGIKGYGEVGLIPVLCCNLLTVTFHDHRGPFCHEKLPKNVTLNGHCK